MKVFKVTGLEFKTPELEEEFQLSGHIDPRLRAIEYYMAFYCWREFEKKWIITQIHRGDQEQIRLYKEHFQKYNRIKPSKHCMIPVRAIDKRSYNFGVPNVHADELEEKQIVELKDAFYRWFGQMGGDTKVLFKYHKGTALHIHIEV